MSSSNFKRQRLTVAIIVRNDAPRLADTLECVEGIADEIVVVDTGSSDNSRDVARQYGARVTEFEWCDDFSAARNHALAHVSGDWILWLDSGETLLGADAAELRERIDGGLDDAKAYMLIVKPPVAPGTIAAEQIACVRLAPRHGGIRYYGRVRESLFESLQANGLALEGLPWRIRRPHREHDADVKTERARRNERLANKEAAETGRSATLINCLAEAAQTLGNTTEAITLYRECLGAHQATSSERLEAYYGLLTCLDKTAGARSAQLALCVEALEQFPLDAQLLCAMGGYLQSEGRLDLAIRSYETAYQYGRVNPLTWHLDEITAIAAVCLSHALQANNEDDQALDVLQTAIDRHGNCPRLARAVVELHVKHNRVDEALAQVEFLGLNKGQQNNLRTAVQGACLAGGQDWAAAEAHLQAAYDAGCRDALCLRWMTIVCLNRQNVDAALEVLDDWRQTSPLDPEPLQLRQIVASADGRAPNGTSQRRSATKQIRVDASTKAQQPGMPSRPTVPNS